MRNSIIRHQSYCDLENERGASWRGESLMQFSINGWPHTWLSDVYHTNMLPQRFDYLLMASVLPPFKNDNLLDMLVHMTCYFITNNGTDFFFHFSSYFLLFFVFLDKSTYICHRNILANMQVFGSHIYPATIWYTLHCGWTHSMLRVIYTFCIMPLIGDCRDLDPHCQSWIAQMIRLV